jgi:hypothetical protein
MLRLPLFQKKGKIETKGEPAPAPVFNADGSVKTPAYVTAFFNGVLVQNHFALKGQTLYICQPFYTNMTGCRSSFRRTAIPASRSASAIFGCGRWIRDHYILGRK